MDQRTAEILDRFSLSWEKTDSFLENLINKHPDFERLKPVREFIASLKKKGEDKFFRLGTSIHWLLISRSVDHVLRVGQKYIKIDAFDNNRFHVIMADGEKVYREYTVSDLNDTKVINLLKTLKSTLID